MKQIINSPDSMRNTPLYYAVFNNDVEKVEELMDKGEDPNIQNNDGKTPLHAAFEKGYEDLIRLLIANGGNPFINDKYLKIPLDYANNEIKEKFKNLINYTQFKFTPSNVKYNIKKPDNVSEILDNAIEVLVYIHGMIDTETIYMNTNDLIIGLASFNRCALYATRDTFKNIVPLGYYSKYSIIPNIYLFKDTSNVETMTSCIMINNYNILHKVYPEGNGRLSVLLNYLLNNFLHKKFIIKIMCCMGNIDDGISLYTKCYTKRELPDKTDIYSYKVIIINVDGEDEIFYQVNIDLNIFFPTKSSNLLSKKLLYDGNEINKYDNNNNILYKTDNNVWVPENEVKNLPKGGIRMFIDVPEENRNSGGFTNDVTFKSLKDNEKNIIDLSNPHVNEKVIEKVKSDKIKEKYGNYGITKFIEELDLGNSIIILSSEMACALVIISNFLKDPLKLPKEYNNFNYLWETLQETLQGNYGKSRRSIRKKTIRRKTIRRKTIRKKTSRKKTIRKL